MERRRKAKKKKAKRNPQAFYGLLGGFEFGSD